MFQEEWDSLALQTHKLQQDLAQARQELSHALYQQDAAVRVISRLTKERDEAREALGRVNVAAPTNGDAMNVDSAPLPANIVDKVQSTQDRYVPSYIYTIYRIANLAPVYPQLDGSARFQKTGLLASISLLMLPKVPPERNIRAVRRSQSTKLEISS